MLYVHGKCSWLCKSVATCFAISYAGAFFQFIIGLMGVFSLCNFIVA
jgi:hypothetical protein